MPFIYGNQYFDQMSTTINHSINPIFEYAFHSFHFSAIYISAMRSLIVSFTIPQRMQSNEVKSQLRKSQFDFRRMEAWNIDWGMRCWLPSTVLFGLNVVYFFSFNFSKKPTSQQCSLLPVIMSHLLYSNFTLFEQKTHSPLLHEIFNIIHLFPANSVLFRKGERKNKIFTVSSVNVIQFVIQISKQYMHQPVLQNLAFEHLTSYVNVKLSSNVIVLTNRLYFQNIF